MDGTSRMFAPFADKECTKSVSISDAILAFMPFDKLTEIVKNNASVINNKELHGHTSLHKAALRGDPKITELLIQNGANIHATNDYGETAFHFSCKQGSVVNLYALLKSGADATFRDTMGRSGMHHAACGGSVVAMHYLATVLDIPYDDVDFGGVTPLHLASSQGFQDAIKYLLRKERSDARFKDSNGNIALHYACTTGLTETVWTLVEFGGCGTLTEANSNGQTPMNILSEGKTRSHAYIRSQMESLTDAKDPRKPPSGPLLSWFVMLLVPAVSLVNIVFTGYLFRGYSGLVVTILTVILFSYIIKQNHRLPHMSRWSNPVYAGAFGAGIFHTGVVYILLTNDPGACQTSRNSNSHLEEYTTVDHIAKGQCDIIDFCVTCEIIPPERVKHCKICQKCFYDHDHHCLFLLTCIARNNHRSFIFFLLLTSLLHALFSAQAGIYLILSHLGGDMAWMQFFSIIFFKEGWLNMLIAGNILSIFWELTVVSAQFLVISRGLTATYRPSGWNSKYKMTTRDQVNNICYFLKGKRTYTARDLYHTNVV
ncbi:putative palmitoyltransferase AKR1 isoform X2 [Apostichopus japonicus]|uniref:Palmitoyltransferase n=1 Tax=Stichopus japonicus TaxID=307972 RepID=A0A2G8KE38_STIJA|nr:putative palmitoyltransferase AKR1 isoform X2 [Apostichopus japonicus]